MNKEIETATYTYREQLEMLDFVGDYDFNASEADDAEWAAVIKRALAAGWGHA
jgi:hypothetical protein